MAIIHRATLQPTKLELLAGWLPSHPWFGGDDTALTQVGAFRFDDPDGEVGLQVLLVRAGDDGPVYQVPMTYRADPLEGASDGLIGEMDHSVLGHRYVYDGCHDPVFVSELVRAVLTGGTEVDELVTVDGTTTTAPKSVRVTGSGQPLSAAPLVEHLHVTSAGSDSSLTVVRTAGLEVTLPRVLSGALAIDGHSTLVGEWGDGEAACLASLRDVASA
jgi:hypothetical protein